eukprot:Gb_07202 [translate_table: standard]
MRHSTCPIEDLNPWRYITGSGAIRNKDTCSLAMKPHPKTRCLKTALEWSSARAPMKARHFFCGTVCMQVQLQAVRTVLHRNLQTVAESSKFMLLTSKGQMHDQANFLNATDVYTSLCANEMSSLVLDSTKRNLAQILLRTKHKSKVNNITAIAWVCADNDCFVTSLSMYKCMAKIAQINVGKIIASEVATIGMAGGPGRQLAKGRVKACSKQISEECWWKPMYLQTGRELLIKIRIIKESKEYLSLNKHRMQQMKASVLVYMSIGRSSMFKGNAHWRATVRKARRLIQRTS